MMTFAKIKLILLLPINVKKPTESFSTNLRQFLGEVFSRRIAASFILNAMLTRHCYLKFDSGPLKRHNRNFFVFENLNKNSQV